MCRSCTHFFEEITVIFLIEIFSWKECKNKGIDICHPGFPEAKRRLLGKNYVEYEKKTFLVK